MSFVISTQCLDHVDRSCVDACPVDCIYDGGQQLFILADECVSCGACEPACPVGAIYKRSELPESLEGAVNAADRYFSQNPDATPARV